MEKLIVIIFGILLSGYSFAGDYLVFGGQGTTYTPIRFDRSTVSYKGETITAMAYNGEELYKVETSTFGCDLGIGKLVWKLPDGRFHKNHFYGIGSEIPSSELAASICTAAGFIHEGIRSDHGRMSEDAFKKSIDARFTATITGSISDKHRKPSAQIQLKSKHNGNIYMLRASITGHHCRMRSGKMTWNLDDGMYLGSTDYRFSSPSESSKLGKKLCTHTDGSLSRKRTKVKRTPRSASKVHPHKHAGLSHEHVIGPHWRHIHDGPSDKDSRNYWVFSIHEGNRGLLSARKGHLWIKPSTISYVGKSQTVEALVYQGHSNEKGYALYNTSIRAFACELGSGAVKVKIKHAMSRSSQSFQTGLTDAWSQLAKSICEVSGFTKKSHGLVWDKLNKDVMAERLNKIFTLTIKEHPHEYHDESSSTSIKVNQRSKITGNNYVNSAFLTPNDCRKDTRIINIHGLRITTYSDSDDQLSLLFKQACNAWGIGQ
ncbi:MAG: hypothetical protein ACPGXY_06785 [Alphaproteobacteria bacterium]